MRQVLGPGALGRPGGSGWRGRWEGGSGWGRHVNSRPFHFNVGQNSLQIKKKKKELEVEKSIREKGFQILYFRLQYASWNGERCFFFPSWLIGKESTCVGLILGLGRLPREGNDTTSSILAWEIPWKRNLVSQKSQT